MSSGNPAYDQLMDEGNAAFRSTNTAAALSCYEKAIPVGEKAGINTFRAHCNASACHALAGAWEEARRSAARCTELEPGFAKGWSRLGTALESLTRYEDALSAFKSAAQRDTANADYLDAIRRLTDLVAKGVGIASKKTTDDFYYKKSLEKGAEAMKNGIFPEAIRHYNKAIDLCTDPVETSVLYANRSAAQLKKGALQEAVADAERSVEMNPRYCRGYIRLGAATRAVGDFSKSRNAFEKAVELDPANEAAKEGVVEARRLYAQNEAEKEALKKADEALRKSKTDKIMEQRDEKAREEKAEEEARLALLPAEMRFRKTRGVLGYEYCRMCNEYGHLAGACPLRKKPRYE